MIAPLQKPLGYYIYWTHRIIKEVASYYGVPYENIIGPDHKRPAVYARRMAMALIYWHLDLSYSDIARIFNMSGHSMSIYHIKNVKESIYPEDHRAFQELSDIIEFQLNQTNQNGSVQTIRRRRTERVPE